MPNGIDLLLADHQIVADLFAELDESLDATVIGRVIDALTAHDAAEQAALYPFAASVLDDPDVIQRSETAHSLIKHQFDLIASLEGPPLVDAFAALRTLVTQHVADEEEHLFPALAERATAQQLEALGARILQAKQRGG